MYRRINLFPYPLSPWGEKKKTREEDRGQGMNKRIME
jgi:hypothetical protein